VPPLLPVEGESPGFLATIELHSVKKILQELFDDKTMRITKRSRLSCTIYRHHEHNPFMEDEASIMSDGNQITMEHVRNASELETQWLRKEIKRIMNQQSDEKKRKYLENYPNIASLPTEIYEVMNELVIHGGINASGCCLDFHSSHKDACSDDSLHICSIATDGLCVATPTGSTSSSVREFLFL
jgi:NAD kinase